MTQEYLKLMSDYAMRDVIITFCAVVGTGVPLAWYILPAAPKFWRSAWLGIAFVMYLLALSFPIIGDLL